MRILHLISSGGMYGAEAVILNLSLALNSAGENTTALALFNNSARPNLQLRQAAEKAGLETHSLECRGQFDPRLPSRIRELAKTLHSDIVHAHGYKADIYAGWALGRADVALVATCHNWIDNGMALRLYGWLDRRTLRGFQRIAAVSQAVRARLLASGVRPDRVEIIPNGILLPDYSLSEHIADGSPLTIGLAGRLSPEKGIDIFIQASETVLRHTPSARFLIAGDGPEHDRLQSLIRDLNLHDRVQLLGRCEDMAAFYASLDMLVISSHTEGLPMALLEGMAYGLPVVATRVGDIPSVLEEEKTGKLVAPGDSSALASAMTELLSDPGRRRAMRVAARERVAAEFSASAMAQRYVRLYRDALASKKERS
jgi:glycosyltransferase involved in cell wall biosynthesis